MDGNRSKAQLLDELRDEQAGWEALLRDIGEEHMTQPGVAGEWSVKDIIAHLTFWRRRTVARFQAALRNEPLPPEPWPAEFGTAEEIDARERDDATAWDAVNAWDYAANYNRPLADVLRDSHAVFDQLVATLGAFPEADLLNPVRFPWIAAEDFPLAGALFFGHFHDEHEPDMRAWLAKIRR